MDDSDIPLSDPFVPSPVPESPSPLGLPVPYSPSPLDLTDLRDKFAEAQRRIEKLEQQVARLSLLCGALAEHNGLSGEQLAAAVAVAKKKREAVFHCTRCGKTLQRSIAKCIYCGAANPHVANAMP